MAPTEVKRPASPHLEQELPAKRLKPYQHQEEDENDHDHDHEDGENSDLEDDSEADYSDSSEWVCWENECFCDSVTPSTMCANHWAKVSAINEMTKDLGSKGPELSLDLVRNPIEVDIGRIPESFRGDDWDKGIYKLYLADQSVPLDDKMREGLVRQFSIFWSANGYRRHDKIIGELCVGDGDGNVRYSGEMDLPTHASARWHQMDSDLKITFLSDELIRLRIRTNRAFDDGSSGVSVNGYDVLE